MKYLLAALLVLGVEVSARHAAAVEPVAQPRHPAGDAALPEPDNPAPAVPCTDGPGEPVSDSRVSAQNLIGMRVTNPINEEIGEVSDLLLNQCGRIEKLVVYVGGFLGIGGRHVRVSLDKVRIRSTALSDGMVVVVRQTRDYIMNQENAVSESGNGD